MNSDGEEVTSDGKSFHIRASATGKARRPTVESLTAGTNRLSVTEDRTIEILLLNLVIFRVKPCRHTWCLFCCAIDCCAWCTDSFTYNVQQWVITRRTYLAKWQLDVGMSREVVLGSRLTLPRRSQRVRIFHWPHHLMCTQTRDVSKNWTRRPYVM